MLRARECRERESLAGKWHCDTAGLLTADMDTGIPIVTQTWMQPSQVDIHETHAPHTGLSADLAKFPILKIHMTKNKWILHFIAPKLDSYDFDLLLSMRVFILSMSYSYTLLLNVEVLISQGKLCHSHQNVVLRSRETGTYVRSGHSRQALWI